MNIVPQISMFSKDEKNFNYFLFESPLRAYMSPQYPLAVLIKLLTAKLILKYL